ncbi:MAG TPA: serine hydrolase domain-containing protein, partial [Permianibacter sp.]|nr:serine hydrolase domain-containing protein [Permianibacter sp.]
TAASVFLLVQDGKLTLDDDVRKLLPELPDYGHRITVAHLLHHTSGLRDYAGMHVLAGRPFANYTRNADAMAFVTRQRALNFKPGTAFSYSNTGYLLLGQLVERVSGKTLAQFADERIFQPLAMHDTRFLDTLDALVPNKAGLYQPNMSQPNMSQSNSEPQFDAAQVGWVETGARGVLTTVADLAKWERNFVAPTVGGVAFVTWMQTGGKLDNGAPLDYGGGLSLSEYRGLKVVEHGGAGVGAAAELLRLPDEKFAVALLCNNPMVDAQGIAYQIAELYLADKPSAPPGEPSHATNADATTTASSAANTTGSMALSVTTEALNAAAGLYWSKEGGLVRRVELRDGKLWYVRHERSRSELQPLGSGRFRMLNVPGQTDLQIVPTKAGQPRRLELISDGEPPIVFEQVQPFSPAPDALHQYAGCFANAELGTRWQLLVADGQLLLQYGVDPAQPVTATFIDAFSAGPALMRYQRDKRGKMNQFILDSSRARNYVFDRVTMARGERCSE